MGSPWLRCGSSTRVPKPNIHAAAKFLETPSLLTRHCAGTAPSVRAGPGRLPYRRRTRGVGGDSQLRHFPPPPPRRARRAPAEKTVAFPKRCAVRTAHRRAAPGSAAPWRSSQRPGGAGRGRGEAAVSAPAGPPRPPPASRPLSAGGALAHCCAPRSAVPQRGSAVSVVVKRAERTHSSAVPLLNKQCPPRGSGLSLGKALPGPVGRPR